MSGTIVLQTATGINYAFTGYRMDVNWNDVAGLYAFIGPKSVLGGPGWNVLYIGQTESYKDRMAAHCQDVWLRAQALGATTVAAMLAPIEASRLAVERDLIQYYNPPLNTQHRTGLAALLGGVARPGLAGLGKM